MWKNSSLQELIHKAYVEIIKFHEKWHFYEGKKIYNISFFGKNSYLKVLSKYFLDHEKHFKYLSSYVYTKIEWSMTIGKTMKIPEFTCSKMLTLNFSSKIKKKIWIFYDTNKVVRQFQMTNILFEKKQTLFKGQ